ncbi:glycosyltransferase, partial [Haloquadratum walsbyi]
MSIRGSLSKTRSDEDGPLVSVILPTYEDSEYIGSALRSIAAQTYSHVEVILIDSSGVSWLKSLADEVDWIKYSFQKPTGLAAARNKGIDLAEGEYVGFLDADDKWLPEKLDRQLDVLNNGVDLVYSDVYIQKEKIRRRVKSLPINDPETHHIDFLYEGGVPILSVVVRRRCLETECFDESLPAVEDRHIIIRLFHEYTPGRVAEPLAVYTRRADSMSSNADMMHKAEIMV